MGVRKVLVRGRGVAFAAAAALLAACGGTTTIAPFQPEIRNLTDSFEFQVTNAKNVSQNLQYNWENTGTMANVNQDSSISNGSAEVMIRDAQDTVVYVRNLADNGTFVTNAGQAGSWKIQVSLSNFSGTINFRAQKSTP
jgi:hypothetical protein